MAMTQRAAVYAATLAALATAGVEFTPGVTIIHDVETEDVRRSVVDSVCQMFQNGEVEFAATESNAQKLADPKELRRYVNGLRTNWWNKDKALNAGQAYEPKAPGSRAGAGDDTLKNLRAYRKVLAAQGVSAEALAKVDAAIDARASEIAASKATAKLPNIDFDALPADIRDLLKAA